MSESEEILSENTENEEIIFLEYPTDVGTIETNGEQHIQENDLDADSIANGQKIIIEDVDNMDSPDLVNVEEFKNDNTNYTTATENVEDASTAVLCETSYDSEISSEVNSIEKDDETDNRPDLFQLVNMKDEKSKEDQEDDDICEISDDIPTEALVYTCPPTNNDFLNKFICKLCGMVAGCVFCLKSHYESVHLNLGIIQYRCQQTSYLKNYTEICNKCSLVCESQQEMVEHRKIHFVTCDVCEMSFDSALFLSNHCRIAHEKFEVIISCDLCEQWFKQLDDLSLHYEDYHEMILCIVCFERFSTRAELEQHHSHHAIVLKNNEKILPYACSKCNKAFLKIGDLSIHLSRDHPKKKSPTYGAKGRLKLGRDCGGLPINLDDEPEVEVPPKKKKKKIKKEDD